MALPARMRFGIFMAPFHRLGENPTLAIRRDLELIQWLDELGYDEAWIGEHHSAGWETIASPEVFIGIAAERTRHIRLGTGVVSLPYHHPLMVANRMILLDHMTQGRVMLGVGPGALVSDAAMLGVKPDRQRPMMDESLGIIMRLLTETEPITHQSDWFELHDATTQLRSYQQPHLPVAVASMQSPSGMILAGKHGAGVLSLAIFTGVRGPVEVKKQWQIAEETAAEHGKTMCRDELRLVVPVHLAESRREAFEDSRHGAAAYLIEYLERTNGRRRPVEGPPEKIVEVLADAGSWIVGTPDDAIATLERLDELSGGYGGLMILAHEWASREKTLKSYELFARYVMPRFQGSLVGLVDSQRRCEAQSHELRQAGDHAIELAHQAYEEKTPSPSGRGLG
jgi:limonene 1,2-monooxygenase